MILFQLFVYYFATASFVCCNRTSICSSIFQSLTLLSSQTNTRAPPHLGSFILVGVSRGPVRDFLPVCPQYILGCHISPGPFVLLGLFTVTFEDNQTRAPPRLFRTFKVCTASTLSISAAAFCRALVRSSRFSL